MASVNKEPQEGGRVEREGEGGVGGAAASSSSSSSAGGQAKTTTVHRYYIDVRALAPPPGRREHVPLPLLSTLPHELQESIQKYLRPIDRLMSLSSALIKYWFIHRQVRLPWEQVVISRTARPHGRPYWSPPDDWRLSHEGGLEFNVTHQNGLVGLVGCTTPTVQDPQIVQPRLKSQAEIRLGVDVSCVREAGRGPSDVTTQAKLDEWIDIFGEIFSEKCRNEIRNAAPPPPPPPPPTAKWGAPTTTSVAATMQARLRRFYAFWALKEAYIKMVGEGLLADWLTKLEFENVQVPQPANKEEWADANPDDGFSWALRTEEEVKWTPSKHAVRDIRAVLDGKPVDGVQIGLVAYEDSFIFATAVQGVVEQASDDTSWRKLDFENDIRPCAEGRCKCLDIRG